MAGLWTRIHQRLNPQTALPVVRPPLAVSPQMMPQLWPRLDPVIKLGLVLAATGTEAGMPLTGTVSTGAAAVRGAATITASKGGGALGLTWCLVMPQQQQQQQGVVASRGVSTTC